MNMGREIKNAFDSVHAPDELVERMKQELYQKDFHESSDEIVCRVTEVPKRHFWRYAAFTAAVFAICAGCGLSVWKLNSQVSSFDPQAGISGTPEETEPTTESPENENYAAAV